MNIQGLPSVAHGTAVAPSASTAGNNSSTSGATLNANDATATFIQLLVTELKAQDPTSPMDPTTMVGQMFSMNQLQQLIDINQTLSSALGGVPPTTGGAAPASVSPNTVNSLLPASTLPASAAAQYAQHLLKGAN